MITNLYINSLNEDDADTCGAFLNGSLVISSDNTWIDIETVENTVYRITEGLKSLKENEIQKTKTDDALNFDFYHFQEDLHKECVAFAAKNGALPESFVSAGITFTKDEYVLLLAPDQTAAIDVHLAK